MERVTNINLIGQYLGEELIVPIEIAHSYKGDFYGLLKHLDIDGRLIAHTMKANDIKSSTSYDGTLTRIKTVDITILGM